MKKTGFTLAEVLITLSIIGVVATMTLPALMTNTAEQQYKTGLRKGINTLSEAAQANAAIDGFDFSGIKDASSSDNTENQSMFALLANRAQIDIPKSNVGTATAASNKVDNTQGNFVVFFRDGSAISFPSEEQNTDAVLAPQEDGLPYGIKVVYDINGTKGPNLLSNCSTETAWTASTTAANDAGDEACEKTNRVIKDQFGLRLRGSVVVPNGRAARWAYEN